MNTQIFKAYSCDERLVPEYVLPDMLLCKNETRIDTAAEWMNFRRHFTHRKFIVFSVQQGRSSRGRNADVRRKYFRGQLFSLPHGETPSDPGRIGLVISTQQINF